MSYESWKNTGLSEWKFHNEAAINYAAQYIKASLILNGGAALALLAVAGQIYSKHDSTNQELPLPLISSLDFFGYGALAAVLTAFFAYLTEFYHAGRVNALHNENKNINKIEKTGNICHGLAIFLSLLSLVLFLLGLMYATEAFSSVNLAIENKELLTNNGSKVDMEFNIISVLHEWQTLAAGILAVLGALATIIRMRYNHNDIVRRRHIVAKAYMHDALSEISDYCKKMIICLDGTSGENPIKPEDAIKSLKDNIGYTDTVIAEQISKLLSCYQIFNSRNRRKLQANVTLSHGVIVSSKSCRIVEVMEIHALTSGLFSYARNRKENDGKRWVSKRDILSSYSTIQGNVLDDGVSFDIEKAPYNDVMKIINSEFK